MADITAEFAAAHQDPTTYQTHVHLDPVTKRYVWHLDDHVITFALADDHRPQPGDVPVSPETANATADRLEPQLAQEFMRAVGDMQDRIDTPALTAALESGDPNRVAAVLSQAQLHDALANVPMILHDAAVRGATGAAPDEGDPPADVLAEVETGLDGEATDYADELVAELGADDALTAEAQALNDNPPCATSRILGEA